MHSSILFHFSASSQRDRPKIDAIALPSLPRQVVRPYDPPSIVPAHFWLVLALFKTNFCIFLLSPSPILSKPPNMMPCPSFLLVARRIQCSYNQSFITGLKIGKVLFQCCDVLSMFVLSKWQFWNLFGAPDALTGLGARTFLLIFVLWSKNISGRMETKRSLNMEIILLCP